ncbi:hypothetical protein X798_04458 [Onchocerca flexuosa]|uniref:Uncharacterized protein n=1 Tax=Onchocerca flexuosa TaxID=387005 RepID=A0A238BU59_9BILA|nr:hypothetical protein X798_04458 [Onchocerca flexuosa]
MGGSSRGIPQLRWLWSVLEGIVRVGRDLCPGFVRVVSGEGRGGVTWCLEGMLAWLDVGKDVLT